MTRLATTSAPPLAKPHETKFVLPETSAPAVIAWLERRCLPDPEYPAGIISSLYYDSPDWRTLREKVDSDYRKTKIRLRWYADLGSGAPLKASFMEAKLKIGSRRDKVRLQTDLTGAWLEGAKLWDPRLRLAPRLLATRGVNVPGRFLPAFVVRYRRRRFVEPTTGAHLNVDYDIQVPRVNPQMLPRVLPFRLSEAVFELKGEASELPELLHPLTGLGCRKRSFSKYLECYVRIMRTWL